ncbi:MAG: hypothetical protein ACLR7D_05810 [Lachnospira eligens]
MPRHEEIHRTPIVGTDLNDCMGLPMSSTWHCQKLLPTQKTGAEARNATLW